MTSTEKLLHARMLEAGLRLIRRRAMKAHVAAGFVAGTVPDDVAEWDVLIDHAGQLVAALSDEIDASITRANGMRRPANAMLATPTQVRRVPVKGTAPYAEPFVIVNGAHVALV
jgi:hypothetical protein